MRAALKGALRLLGFLLLCGFVFLVQPLILLFTKGPAADVIPFFWHRTAVRLFGLKVVQEGSPRTERPTVFVSNHLSYLDIPVLGTLLPASFVAKDDIVRWPLFGPMGRLQQTAYISRARHKTAVVKYALDTLLSRGRSLILFPEGTSSPGTSVLPFKSSLFASMYTHQVAVQPVTIRLESVDERKPDDPAVRDRYAWHGEMTLAPHLWAFAKGKGARVTVIFHEPVAPASFPDRQALAVHCHALVASALDTNPEKHAA
ncbi:MAG: 1-acyl-sn-glycerol-3-phosphate acyltransferase [Alphaproteobacteria bacterium]|nr:1-acyl-sn-glycerol-3-phosphate acyltransferase [Alphaproteobacteria bacterium]